MADTPRFGKGTDLNARKQSPAAKGLGKKGLKGWKNRRQAKRQSAGRGGSRKR